MCIALYCMCILFYYRSLLVSTQPENFTSCILESYEKNNLGNPGKKLYLGTYANNCISEPMQTIVFGNLCKQLYFRNLCKRLYLENLDIRLNWVGLSENHKMLLLPQIYIIAHRHLKSSCWS